MPLIKLPTFPAFIGFQYLYSPPLASLQLLAFILFQYLNFPLSAPQQLPAFIWFHMWHPCGLPAISCQHLASIFLILKLSHTCASQQLPAFMRFLYLYRLPPLSLHNFLHASSFGINIFALIWIEYLYFPPALASPQTSCVHLVSISKIPPRCPSTTSCIHLVSISKLPPRCPSATS